MTKKARYFFIGGAEPEDDNPISNVLFPNIDDNGIDRLYDYARNFDPATASSFTGTKREFVYYIFITFRQFFGVVDSFGIPAFPSVGRSGSGKKKYIGGDGEDGKDGQDGQDGQDGKDEEDEEDESALIEKWKNDTEKLIDKYIEDNKDFLNETTTVLDETSESVDITYEDFKKKCKDHLKKLWEKKDIDDTSGLTEEYLKACFNITVLFTKEVNKDTDIKPKMTNVLNLTKTPAIFNFVRLNDYCMLDRVKYIQHDFSNATTAISKPGEYIVYVDTAMCGTIGLPDLPNSLGLIPLMTQQQLLQDSDQVDISYISKDNVLRVAEIKTKMVYDHKPTSLIDLNVGCKIKIAHHLYTLHKENKTIPGLNNIKPPSSFPFITNIASKVVVQTRSGLKNTDAIPISIVIDLYKLFEDKTISVNNNKTEITMDDGKIKFASSGTVSGSIPSFQSMNKKYVKVFTRSSRPKRIYAGDVKKSLTGTNFEIGTKLNQIIINHLRETYGEDVMTLDKYKMIPELEKIMKKGLPHEERKELYKEDTGVSTTKPKATKTKTERSKVVVDWTTNDYNQPLKDMNIKNFSEGNRDLFEDAVKLFISDVNNATDAQLEQLNNSVIPMWIKQFVYEKARTDNQGFISGNDGKDIRRKLKRIFNGATAKKVSPEMFVEGTKKPEPKPEWKINDDGPKPKPKSKEIEL